MNEGAKKEMEKMMEVTVINVGEDEEKEKEFDKNYNNLLKLKQEMLETKEKKRVWKIFNCNHIIEKKNNERKLLAFVIFLFFIIIGGLIVIYCFHEEELYYIYKGNGIVVDEKTLDFEIFNHNEEVVASGTFWKSRPKDRLPYDCSSNDGSAPRDLCLLWMKSIKLNIANRILKNDTKCHEITWTSSSNEGQHDCFNLGQAHWFGGGLVESRDWPLQKLSFSKKKFVTGKLNHNTFFGPVLERYWLNSLGVAIVVAENSSLEISIRQKESPLKDTTDSQLCLYANPDKVHNYSDLSYTICVAPNILEVHDVALPLALESANLSTTDISFDTFLQPFWSTWSYLKMNYTQESLLNFAADIKNRGYGHKVLLIDNGWEDHYGDVFFDVHKFPDPASMVGTLHGQGFNVSLVVYNQVDTDSISFHQSTLKDYLINDAGGHVPGLIRWSYVPFKTKSNVGVAGILDVMDNSSYWHVKKLNDFKTDYSIDSFHFAGGDTSSLPSNPSFKHPVFDPNDYTKHYAKLASSFGQFVPIESAYKAQNHPVVIRIVNKKSTWSHFDGLQSIIPTALNLGLIGYRLFLPEAVGGSAWPEPPTKDLYLRWLQINIFMPFMQFSIPPHHFGNDTEMAAHNLMQLRRKLVVPEIVRVYETSLVTEPIIRPIWWLSPNDKEAMDRKDEFLVGEKILVAPIITPDVEYRDIYLPDGLWEDINNDRVHIGPKMLKNYRAPLFTVPYFVKK